MAQKIKVQDGNIVYQTGDPSYEVNFNIEGQLVVAKNVAVGDNTTAAGTVTTSTNQNLTLTTGTTADIIIAPTRNLILSSPTGATLINGVTWPPAPQSVTQGQFLGASGLNTLEFYPFVFSVAGSDTLTVSQLNTLYPTIQPGQSVIGPNVVYDCVGSGQWRIIQPSLGYTPVNLAGDTMTGYLILNGDPVADDGAATKRYVDQLASGVNIHGAVETSTTPASNLPLNSYTNGTSGGGFDPGGQGVGATLIAQNNGNLNTLGVGGYSTLSNDSRILIKDQVNGIENGIYLVTSLGSEDIPGPGSKWVLTRASDYNNSQPNQVHAGTAVYIQEGTLSGTQWIEIQQGTGPQASTIIGTDLIEFSQFSGAGTFTGGPGINIAGNIISNTGVLEFNTRTGNITLTNSDVTNALGYAPGTGNGSVTSIGMTVPNFLSVMPSAITTSGTFAVSLSGTALPIANGGTGQTTANDAFNSLAPSQATNTGKFLTTDGTDTSWASAVQTTNGSVVAGSGPLTTTATDGFFYIPTCPGVPTGVPTTVTGFAPMVIDSTDNRLYIYIGGNWLAINVAVYS